MKIKYSNLSIKLRVTLLYSIIFSVILIILNASVLYGLKYYLIYQAFNDVENQSESLIDKLNAVNGSFNELDEKLLFSSIQENIYIKMIDSSGNVIYESNRIKINNINLPYKININKPVKTDKDDTDLTYLNKMYVNKKGHVYIQVIENMKSQYTFLKLLFILMAIADTIGILISFFVGYFLTKQALRPVDYMVREVHDIDAKRVNKRLKVGKNNDELSRLAITFNNMLDRIEDYIKRQNEFISDASHELRTPLSVFKGYIDLIDRWGKNNRDVLDESIAALKNEQLEMEKLIKRLLILAKGDNETLKLEKSSFILNDLINEIVTELKMIFKHKNIKIINNYEIRIFADKSLVKELIRIILDNACKYTEDDGIIIITLFKDEESVKLSIKDNGIGIPKDEIPYIFDRFYRVDKARDKETGGSGLGLSIAKLIADLNNWKIIVKSELYKGTEFIIEILN